MSDPLEPPPEVPDEFAAAYRAAYEQAMRATAGGRSHRAGEARPEPVAPVRPSGRERWDALRAGAAEALVGWRRQRWFLPVVAGVGALVLVLVAYLLGRAFSGDDRGSAATTAGGPAVYSGDTSTQAPGTPAVSTGKAWRGEVEAVTPTRVRASCTAPPGVDSAGAPVSYRAGNVADGDRSSAWRCDGAASGVRLVLRLPGPTELGEVGIVPGYAKTDPVSGADRYAQNNRVTRVRWTIGDIVVVQRLDGAPDDRRMQRLRIPRTEASRVTLEILDVERGPRDTTAISEVRLAAARR
jgi:hypothetical protein